jgi:hypothetical protein
MTVQQQPRQSGDAYPARGWHRFGDRDQVLWRRKGRVPKSTRTLRLVIRARGGHHQLRTALPNPVSNEPTKLEVE